MKRFIMFLVAFFALVTSFAQSKPVVVVAPFDANGVDQEDVDIITEAFISEYANTGEADVVDRNSFEKIKAEVNFQSSEWSNTEKVAELGRALNASQVVVGQFRRLRTGDILVVIRVEDVNTTKILASLPANTRLKDSLDALEKVKEWCESLSSKASGENPAKTSKSNVDEKKIAELEEKRAAEKKAEEERAKKEAEKKAKEVSASRSGHWEEIKIDDGWGLGKSFLFSSGIAASVLGLTIGGLEGEWGVGCALSGGGLLITFFALLIDNEYHYEQKWVSKIDNGNALKNLNVAFAPNILSVGYTLHL